MSPMRSTLEFEVRRAGAAGVIGMFLLTLLPGFYWMAIRPRQAEIDQVSARIAAVKSQPDDAEAPRSREERIRAFVEFFPEHTDVPYWIGRIHEVANGEGVSLSRGEYRLTGSEGPVPLALRIHLPLKGSYAQIRRFVTAALAAVPTLALDDISFQRQGAQEARVEAQVRFTLYIGGRR